MWLCVCVCAYLFVCGTISCDLPGDQLQTLDDYISATERSPLPVCAFHRGGLLHVLGLSDVTLGKSTCTWGRGG